MRNVRRISTLPAIAAIITVIGVAHSPAGSVASDFDADYAPDQSSPWYHQPPLRGTGPGLYYSYHPFHVPGYPEELRGYPVPIYSTAHPIMRAPAVRYRSASAAHIAWCRERWLTYRVWNNTYQPLYGARRQCRSPYF